MATNDQSGGNAGQLLIIGYGNMSGAMLAGWLNAGGDPSRFAVLNRSPKSVPAGVRQFTDVAQAVEASAHDAIMLGFKPHQLDETAPQFQALAKGVSVHSLLAGKTLVQLQDAYPGAASHIRVMPNLASRINKSPIILMDHGLTDDQRGRVSAQYDILGSAVWLEREEQFDLATALAGSGPGFVYRFIDSLAQAGAKLGLEPDQARNLALSMVDGAASLAAQADLSPGELADRVASPGGMTREGLNVLDDGDALTELLTRTLAATRDRGAKLSSG
ncbi:MAG: pyrroline-5-carboxylate reductase [Erythrobacter sp.]